MKTIKRVDVNAVLESAYGRFESSEDIAEDLEVMLKWHDAKHEVPEVGLKVLGWHEEWDDDGFILLTWDGKTWHLANSNISESYPPSIWMYLPEGE